MADTKTEMETETKNWTAASWKPYRTKNSDAVKFAKAVMSRWIDATSRLQPTVVCGK